MKNFDLYKKNHIFFVGIGGISMSGLAVLLVKYGIKVSGSDRCYSELTRKLEKRGIKVYYNHSADNIASDVDLVVYTAAIPVGNPEIAHCKENNIDHMERAEFLNLIGGLFKNVIAIAGTHGKTTTTALIGEILVNAGLNPTIHIGGEVNSGYNNIRIGSNDYFITEACEFKKGLEYIDSKIGVITNVEKDHMDCYCDIADIFTSFNKFKDKCTDKLFVIYNKNLLNNINHNNLIICGNNENCHYYTKKIKGNKFGQYKFLAYHNKELIGKFKLNMVGKYNVNNALIAIAIAHTLGIDYKIIYNSLSKFSGIKRRNEFLGRYKNVKFFADYAHHPTEISNSIAGYKNAYKKVMVIFQPHTYSRTIALKDDFVNCLNKSDRLIIFKTYAARENVKIGGTETDLFNYINYNPLKKSLILTEEALVKEIDLYCNKYDAVLILGAGDLYDKIKSLLYLKK